jgi:predicted molibdopterin-dependent oxidoreductase YjgC
MGRRFLPDCWEYSLFMDDGLLRLTEPLVREGGRLRPASWDEALDRAAAGFDAARKQGPNAFGMFSCSKATNEMNFMAQKFTRVVMHSNNVDSCNRT